MKRSTLATSIITCAGLFGDPAFSEPLVNGSITVGGRVHTSDAEFSEQADNLFNVSAKLKTELPISETVDANLRMLVFSRSDGNVSDIDVQEAFIRFRLGDWRIEAGQGMFTYGQSLGSSVYDAVNTRNFVRDITDPDKLGQPFIGLGYASGSWDLQALALYGHRQPTFANDISSRFRLATPVDDSNPIYTGGAGNHDWSAALSARYRGSQADIEFFLFQGPSRVPYLSFDALDSRFIPAYPETQIAAIGMQKAFDTWLLGAELGVERVDGKNETIYSLSAEKRFYIEDTELTITGQIGRQRGSLVRGVGEDARMLASLNGTLEFNTILPSGLDLMFSFDGESRKLAAASFEYSRNFTDNLELSVSYTTFGDSILPSSFDGLTSLPSDDYVSISLTQSF